MQNLIKKISNQNLTCANEIKENYSLASLTIPQIDETQIIDELHDANSFYHIHLNTKEAKLKLQSPLNKDELQEYNFNLIKVQTPLQKDLREKGFFQIKLSNEFNQWELLVEGKNILKVSGNINFNYQQKVS